MRLRELCRCDIPAGQVGTLAAQRKTPAETRPNVSVRVCLADECLDGNEHRAEPEARPTPHLGVPGCASHWLFANVAIADFARRLVAVGSALPSEMKMPEVCNFENHKCDNGDDQECRQCNHLMPCLKHPIAPVRQLPTQRIIARR